MLREVLRLVVERGTTRSEDLARALDTSPELVREALAELVRHNYLQAVVPGCSTACERCPLRAACLYRRHPRVWILTRKGEAWAAKEQSSRILEG
jgi:Mn-dependent DtxR family transcriptional regulator